MEILQIRNKHLESISALLYERDRALKSYVEWKYKFDDDSRFRGVIAKSEGKIVGCFGIIPKELVFLEGTVKECGWFADWYVSPDARGAKTGEQLLSSLSDHLSIVIGQPGPKPAQNICIENGYHEIGFHSRRRIMLRPWAYSLKRKTLFASIRRKLGYIRRENDSNSKSDRYVKSPTLNNDNDKKQESSGIFFKQSLTHEKWILDEPTSTQHPRKYGEWEEHEFMLKYFDELRGNSEKRRSVLFMSGDKILDADMWNLFIEASRSSKQDYIEIFTCDKKLDILLQKMGAWHIHEAPIISKGLDKSDNLQIQAWDRENWTYLANG